MFDTSSGTPTPDELVAVIEDCERQVAAVQARQVQAIAALVAARRGTPLEEFAADEVSFALTLSPHAARDRVTVAGALVARLPGTLAALGDGQLDYYRARCMVEAVAGLDDAAAAAVESRVLPGAGRCTAAQLKARLRAAVLSVDPAGAESRHARARQDRRVELVPAEDGMAWLSVHQPADDATAVSTCLDGLARAARRASGETRTLDQLRADTLAGIARAILAAGGWNGLTLPEGRPGRHRAHLHVTVGADTLLGVSNEPGWLAGYGPIPASMVRAVARDATWRRILTDPVTGSLLDYSTDTHDPGAVLTGHVVTRDRTCVSPVCTVPASAADLDHTIAHPVGRTEAGNLGPLCRHDHRGKHAGFRVEQLRPGVFCWTTPTGRRYLRDRPALATPRPDYRSRQRPPRPDEPAGPRPG